MSNAKKYGNLPLAAFGCLFCICFPRLVHSAVRYDVVGSPTEVINTGRSEVTGSINLIVRGTGNVTGTSTGGSTQISIVYSNPAMQIDNTTASGIKLFYSSGFLAASPSIVSVTNVDINGQCSGSISINLLPGASPTEGDFVRVEGVRGRIDASGAIAPGNDLFVDLQSVNDPTANSFSPDTVRVAKSFDGLSVSLGADGFGFNIAIVEGFSRAFVDKDASNDGVNANDRTDSSGNALGDPTNSTQILVLMEGIPDGVSGISWPGTSTTAATGAALHLLDSAFSGSTSTATYSYESSNQVGSSDLAVESFTLSPQFVFSAGKCNTDDLTASVTLAPTVLNISGCASPSADQKRPRFLEVYELSILAVSPTSEPKGGPGFSLTIKGTGFVQASIVRWNGTNRTTIYVSSTRLIALVLPADLASPGTVLVTVYNPSLGGVTSNAATFTIQNPALTLFFPRLVSRDRSAPGVDDSEFTGIALANLSTRIATLTLTALDKLGSRIAESDITNPAKITLNAGEQIPVIDRQIWGQALARANPVGWVKVESDIQDVAGFFLTFNESLSFLDGSDVSGTTLTSFVLPEIEGQGFTEIHVCNPNNSAATVAFDLVGADGTPRATSVVRAVNPGGTIAEALSDLFPGLTPRATDYIRGTSNSGVVPFEYLGRSSQYAAALNGQDTAAGSTTIYSPQYVVGGANWESSLCIINLEDTPGSVALKFISDDGTQIGVARVLPIGARGKILITDQKFLVDSGNSLIQGYLEISGSGIRLAGNVVFGDPGRKSFASALPLISKLYGRLVLGQVASNAIYYTGISILNPSDASVNALIEIFNNGGNLVASTVEVIPARRRRSQLLTQYFPGLIGRDISSGYARISLSVGNGLASFAIFGTHSGSVLSAVPAQAVP